MTTPPRRWPRRLLLLAIGLAIFGGVYLAGGFLLLRADERKYPVAGGDLDWRVLYAFTSIMGPSSPPEKYVYTLLRQEYGYSRAEIDGAKRRLTKQFVRYGDLFWGRGEKSPEVVHRRAIPVWYVAPEDHRDCFQRQHWLHLLYWWR